MATLRQLRKQRGLTAWQVAEIMGVTYATVCYWERGERAITAYDLQRLMAFYETDALISQTFELMPRTVKKEN